MKIDIGNRIEIIRKRKGFTQDALAAELGMKASGVSKIEKGKVQLDVYKLIKIAEILDVHVSDFFENENSVAEPQEKMSYVTKDDMAQGNRDIINVVRTEVSQVVRTEISKLRDELLTDKRQQKAKTKKSRK